jgi:hypothetical protein
MTGTISEQRKRSTTEEPTVIKTTVVEVLENKPDLDKMEVLDTTQEPTKPKEPKQKEDSKCTLCKVDKIASLAFRFGLVLVLIALSYHLVKSPK